MRGWPAAVGGGTLAGCALGATLQPVGDDLGAEPAGTLPPDEPETPMAHPPLHVRGHHLSAAFSRGIVSLLALFLLHLPLAGCGGGGSTGEAQTGTTHELGLLRFAPIADFTWTFTNPLNTEATLSQASLEGPFTIHPASVPLTLGAGATVELPMRFAPDAPGTYAGAVNVSYAGGGDERLVRTAFRATAEAVNWNSSPTGLDFGVVPIGQSQVRSVSLINTSSLNTVDLTDITFPSNAFQLQGGGLPATVAPGGALSLTIRYAPLTVENGSGHIVVGPADRGGMFQLPVTASSPGGGSEEVTVFGVQNFQQLGNGSWQTAQLTVNVPNDAISLSLEGIHTSGGSVGLGELIGPGGVVFENVNATGAYIWIPTSPIFNATVPNTDRVNVQLVAGGGAYRFRLRNWQGSGGSVSVRAIVERRPPATQSVGTLPLNVYLAQGIAPVAATAATDTRLQTILASINTVLSQQGITLGDVDYYDVNDATYDFVTQGEFPTMLRDHTAPATEQRLNLFFVQEAFGGGVLGVAAGIAGPRRNGTTLSGVMSIYTGASTSFIGLVAAHEICHFLGLFHTTESDGSHDFVDDTLECPASGAGGPCAQAGGGYLMHWQAVGGNNITGGQGLVIRGHPLVEPGTAPPVAKPYFALAPTRLSARDLALMRQFPGGWCGTCGDARLNPQAQALSGSAAPAIKMRWERSGNLVTKTRVFAMTTD